MIKEFDSNIGKSVGTGVSVGATMLIIGMGVFVRVEEVMGDSV